MRPEKRHISWPQSHPLYARTESSTQKEINIKTMRASSAADFTVLDESMMARLPLDQQHDLAIAQVKGLLALAEQHGDWELAADTRRGGWSEPSRTKLSATAGGGN